LLNAAEVGETPSLQLIAAVDCCSWLLRSIAAVDCCSWLLRLSHARAALTLDPLTPPGLSPISLTFNGGGVGASVSSAAIVLVTRVQAMAVPSEVAGAEGPVMTLTGQQFVAQAAMMWVCLPRLHVKRIAWPFQNGRSVQDLSSDFASKVPSAADVFPATTMLTSR
jgi:hypothetical protein